MPWWEQGLPAMCGGSGVFKSVKVSSQRTYFGPNFRKWSEFRLFPENQSEFGLNLLRMSDFFNFRWPTGPRKGSTDGFLGAPVNFCKASFFIQSLLA